MKFKGKIINGECICDNTPPLKINKKKMARKRGARLYGGVRMSIKKGRTLVKSGKAQKWARKTARKMIAEQTSKRLPPEKFKRYVEAIIASQSGRLGTTGASMLLAALGSEALSVKVGQVYNSIVSPPPGEFTTSKSTVPAEYQIDRMMQSGVNHTFNSNLYKAKFTAGQPITRISKELAKLSGLTRKNIIDTTRDIGDAVLREQLSQKFGFQQKVQGFVDTGYFGYDYNDIENIFTGLSGISSAINREQVAYGMLQNLNSFVRVTNVNKFLPVTLKLHLIRMTNPGSDPHELFPAVCNLNPETTQDEGAMPRIFQFGSATTDDIIRSVVVDPKSTGIKAGYEFRASVDIVKTITKKLYTGDSLELNYNHLVGPGIRLDKIAGMSDGVGFDLNYPITYALMFEAHGPIVEAISGDSNTPNRRYSGTGPGLLSFEFKKTITGVKRSIDATYNTGEDKGFLSSALAVRVFTPTSISNTTKRFNVDYSSIRTSPSVGGSGVYIPIMSDKDVSAAQTKSLI